LALRPDFEPDPDLPALAVFDFEEAPTLKNKIAEQLKGFINKTRVRAVAGAVRQ
jgi:hypothetical protein